MSKSVESTEPGLSCWRMALMNRLYSLPLEFVTHTPPSFSSACVPGVPAAERANTSIPAAPVATTAVEAVRCRDEASPRNQRMIRQPA